MQANRKIDMSIEREMASFMDENLWGKAIKCEGFRRTDELGDQIRGSDLVCDIEGIGHCVIDEKVAARYANSGLNTFSLEVSFINKRGVIQEGWLLDEKKSTTHYLFGWVDKATLPRKENGRFDVDKLTKESVREMSYCLVPKGAILKFLEEKGWTLEKLRMQELRIRQRGYVKTKDFIDGIAFRYSKDYVEKPINILISKDDYFKMSQIHGVVRT